MKLRGREVEIIWVEMETCDNCHLDRERRLVRDPVTGVEYDDPDPDPCWGYIPGVFSACCGHGERPPFILFANGLGIGIEGEISLYTPNFDPVEVHNKTWNQMALDQAEEDTQRALEAVAAETCPTVVIASRRDPE